MCVIVRLRSHVEILIMQKLVPKKQDITSPIYIYIHKFIIYLLIILFTFYDFKVLKNMYFDNFIDFIISQLEKSMLSLLTLRTTATQKRKGFEMAWDFIRQIGIHRKSYHVSHAK